MNNLIQRKVTLYFTNENWFFGNVTKIEATAYGVTVGKYAQYPEAVFVSFIPKGKRKVRGLVQAYSPDVLVLDGWGHPDPDDMMVGYPDGSSVSRYAGFDPRWESDFDSQINPYIKANPSTILEDRRKPERGAR